MIRKTFIILENINEKKEKNLWDLGINDWNDFLNEKKIFGVSDVKKEEYDHKIKRAKAELYSGNSMYFTRVLPSKENWRLYEFFRDDAIFLDIEVNHLYEPVIIGMFNGIDTKTMIKGLNLDFKQLNNEIRKHKIIITYNGSSFDIPIIRRHFPDLINIPHIDLKHCCLKLGLNDGLKQVERRLRIKRPAHLSGKPISLWKAFHASGDDEYLKLMVDYNKEDVVNLRQIMDYCYMNIKEKTLNSGEDKAEK